MLHHKFNTYFDNGATSFPKPPKLKSKIISYIDDGGTYGRGAYGKIVSVSRNVEYVRDLTADYFGVKNSERVIFTSGATFTLNMIIKTILKEKSEVLISKMEHNSVIRPLEKLKEKLGININYLPSKEDGMVDLLELKKNVSSNIDLVIVSHVSNVNGIIQPIEKIKEIIGEIPLLVDSAQGGGEVEINFDKSNIDYLVLAAHKGLLALPGCGVLLLSENSNLESFIEGGTGSLSESFLQPKFLPDKFEAGTPNIPGILSVGVGIEYLRENSNNSIKYSKLLINELRKIDSIAIYSSTDMKYQSSLFSFLINGRNCSEIANLLFEKKGIEVRSGLHCSPLAHRTLNSFKKGGTVRIAPSIFHKEEDITNLMEAIIAINKIVH